MLASSAPIITKQPQSQVTTEGNSVTFVVTAIGDGIEYKDFTTSLSDSVNLEMVWCPPGTFIMGSPENETGRSNEPQHQVTLTKGFWIGKYEVTQEQYKTIIGSNPSHFRGDNLPVEQVDWFDAISFCEKLTAFEKVAGRLPEGYEYTLPTEAQWEYACRAGTKGIYNVDGASLGDVAWYYNNSGMKSHPVGQKIPNAWGIYDMHGNIFELCYDWNEEYSTDAVTDPKGTSSGNLRILRGGSWYDAPSVCRSATRIDRSPSFKDDKRGIRVVLVESNNSATGNLNYQWYKDGFMLQGANDRQYTIEKVSQSDAGQYFVIVSNDVGSVVSDMANLSIAAAGEGFFVSYYYPSSFVSSIASAEDCLNDPNASTPEGYPASEWVNVINYSDFEEDEATSLPLEEHFLDSKMFPAHQYGYVRYKSHVLLAEGDVMISEPGIWSIGVCHDDGFSLSITGNDVDFHSEYNGTTPARDTIRSFDFPVEGVYHFRLLHYNNEGPAALELYAAKGSYSSFNSDFRLIGDIANGGLPVGIVEDSEPVITTQPQSQTIMEGNAVIFSVTATGTNPLSYQWYRDGFILQGGTNRQYTIDKVSPSDAGQYFVIVKNELGNAVSDLAILTVAVPPVIVKQPESLSVLEGEEALLRVEAEHAETYQWYKDSNIINGATNAVYRITNTIQEDAGQYYVLVGNEYKNIQSDRMTLAVYKMPVITRQPVSVSVLGGESVAFSVEAENATDYQWYKNGKIIAGADRPLYIMDGITGYDVGEYFVVASNKKAKVTSDTVTLGISEPYRATAEVVIYNGSVIGFTITDPGWGYEWTPKIRVKDENGSGAEAHCVMENGMVVGIEIDEPGSGYSENAYVKVGSPYKYNSLSIQVSEVLITMFVNLGEKYQLECTEDHITWKKVGEPFIAEDEEVQIRLEVVDHNYYFRVHEVKQ